MWSDGKKVSLAACGSLLLHVLMLLFWAVTSQWMPHPKTVPVAATPPPIHLEVVKMEPTPPPPVDTPTPIPYLDTTSRLLAEAPPEHPKFESAQDTVAASELPATGDEPLPSQLGRKTPAFAFNTAVYTPGETARAASQPPPPTEPPPPQPVASPPPPNPTPRPTPTHTPVPDEEFGLATPTPTPEEVDPGVDPAAFRSPDSTMPPRPSVASRSANQSDAVGFQANQTAANVNGSISKHGESSVDSVATPMGRYQNRVFRAIMTKWYDYYYSRGDLVSLGVVRIRFIVDQRGKVLTPQVLSNSANEALASVSVQALMDAPIPPMPPEMLAAVPRGELPLVLAFVSE